MIAASGEGKNSPKLTVTDREWSLLVGADGHCPPELYHRPSDPEQRENVIAAHPGAAAVLHRELIEFLRGVGSPAAGRMEEALAGRDTGEHVGGEDAPDYRRSETNSGKPARGA